MSWCGIRFNIPDDDAKKIMKFAEDELGLKQIDEDWCTLKRSKDNAIVDYYPEIEPSDRKIGW